MISSGSMKTDEGPAFTIRNISREDMGFLENFLYDAIFVLGGMPELPRSILGGEPRVYIDDFSEGDGDHGLVAETGGSAVGCYWVRIMGDWGHIDDDTPLLAISMKEAYLSNGIDTSLLKGMADLLKREGCGKVSLLVQKENPVLNLYQRLGFDVMKVYGEECVIVLRLI